MLENTYSEEQKLFLFLDWLGCNKDSLDTLWLDSDFILGFKTKCLSEAATELRNRSYYEDLQKNLKEIEGFIYEYLYLDVFGGMKDRHIKDNYQFDNILAVYSVVHQWIGFNKFRDFFKRHYLGLDADIKTQDLEEVELYQENLTGDENGNEIKEKKAGEDNAQFQNYLEIILKEFETYLRKKKRKNSFDLTLFLYAIGDAIGTVGVKIRYKKGNEEIIENIDITADDLGLALFQFLDQSDGLNQDKIKNFIEHSSYTHSFEHSLKKIRLFWKQFEYDNSNPASQAEGYLQILREFTDKKIKYYYKLSDNQETY